LRQGSGFAGSLPDGIVVTDRLRKVQVVVRYRVDLENGPEDDEAAAELAWEIVDKRTLLEDGADGVHIYRSAIEEAFILQ
jgi:hypothetical protein